MAIYIEYGLCARACPTDALSMGSADRPRVSSTMPDCRRYYTLKKTLETHLGMQGVRNLPGVNNA